MGHKVLNGMINKEASLTGLYHAVDGPDGKLRQNDINALAHIHIIYTMNVLPNSAAARTLHSQFSI